VYVLVVVKNLILVTLVITRVMIVVFVMELVGFALLAA
jgi:hypothetical protein